MTLDLFLQRNNYFPLKGRSGGHVVPQEDAFLRFKEDCRPSPPEIGPLLQESELKAVHCPLPSAQPLSNLFKPLHCLPVLKRVKRGQKDVMPLLKKREE